VDTKIHPLFLKLWAGWGLLTIVSFVLPDVFWLRCLWALAFFGIEIPAAVLKNGGARDTLSELVQLANQNMVLRHVSLRGWNALLFVPGIIILSFMAGQLLFSFLPGWLAFVVAVLLAIGLHDHFLYNRKWG
jgi:hypothetical protein